MTDDDQPPGSNPSGIGRRRALLAGGLLGAGGVGGITGFSLADRAPRPVASAGRLDYGPAPSGGDDHARLQDAVDALSGGAALYLRAGAYRLSRQLVVPPGVHLVGEGGFPIAERSGTSVLCTATGAGLWFRGGSNGARDLTVFGNHVGSARAVDGAAAIKVGGTGAGDAGADCYFANVAVGGACGTGWLVQGTQNSLFANCRVQQALGDGLVLDYSAGGLLFERVESGGNAGYNLHCTQSKAASGGGYAVPSDNTFLACVFEQRTTAGPSVLLDQVDVTSFLHCAFASRPGQIRPGDASALVEVRGGRIDLHSPVVYLQGTGRAAVGVHGAAGGAHPQVSIDGLAAISGGAGAFADVDEQAVLHLNGTVLGLHTDTPGVATTLLSAASATTAVRTAGATADSTGAALPSVTAPPGGLLSLDVGAASRHVVELAGRDVTELALRGARAGQTIALIFIQGRTASRLTLPDKAAGFLWSGGDAGRPTLRTAQGYLAVQLVEVSGRWVELSRAGTDVSV